MHMRIFDLEIPEKAVLAPMAGIADSPFRLMARACGAGMVFSELVSADGLVRNSGKTRRLMDFLPEERPFGIQLFGHDPAVLAEAAKIAEALQPDCLDLNFGCPARKVVRRGAGVGVMTDLDRMGRIAEGVVRAVRLPVSAKIRTGWEEGKPVAVEAAKILESCGIRALTLHGRSGQAAFRGAADWSVIRAVRESVSIPVIGNGDIVSAADALRMLTETGCDLVMIGRGALGRPWIFSAVRTLVETGRPSEDPPFRDRIDACLEHYRTALRLLPEAKAVREMRKHIAWYTRGMPGAAELRREAFTLTDPEDVRTRLEAFRDRAGEPRPVPLPEARPEQTEAGHYSLDKSRDF
ncbi:MAG: tRNA dihydrouridine synthase DusB [bacterium]|nr:tRNA dihydrouridine synthase DusB [bacterium]